MSITPRADRLGAATRRIAVLAAVCPLGLGLLGLIAWATGLLRLASLRAEYIPMAPSTALALLLLNGGLILLALRPRASVIRAVRVVAVSLVVVAIVKVVEIISGATIFGLDARLVSSPPSLGSIPLARMSPITAAALAGASWSLVALTLNGTLAWSIGGLAGLAVAGAGASIVLGYGYGAPLLYGGPSIPAALTTGIALAGTGAALVALSGPEALPMRTVFGSAARAEVAESLNREILERTNFALEAAGAGTWELDLQTGRLDWSAPVSRMLGVADEAMQTTLDGFRKVVHPEDWPLVEAAIARAREGHSDYRVQYRVVRPDGSTAWRQAKGRVSKNADGVPVSMLGIAMDITDRKQLELHLQQAQKLESLGRLAGSIAHDFNNVLTAIVGFSELLHQDMDPSDPHIRDVAEIRKAGEAGERLVKQLLAFSRKQPLRPVELDINAVVMNTQTILERLVGHHVQVVTELDPALGRVWGDAGQIQQVLVNLAVNARDAMPDGGLMRVRTCETTVECADADRHEVAPGPYAVLSVSDTGVGMSEETRVHIFEPFFTTKGPEKGTGLGLATVYGIARQSGGFVDVESQLGRGSTFLVYLPHLQTATPQVQPVAALR